MKFFTKTSLRAKLLALSIVTVLVTGLGAWFSLQAMSTSYEKSTFDEL